LKTKLKGTYLGVVFFLQAFESHSKKALNITTIAANALLSFMTERHLQQLNTSNNYWGYNSR